MRVEQEMLDLIVRTAREDDRIRAAYLCGSRVNSCVPKDIFQDYDIVYVVTETGSFRKDRHWIDRFGERLFMQYPEDSVYYPSDVENCYGWLMQLSDGVRLDLHVCTLPFTLKALTEDPLYKILMDKDDCLPAPDSSAEAYYWVKRPTAAEFACTCNEFWWCLNNVAKGLWRGEIPYVMEMLNLYVRPMLVRLLSWVVGFQTGFTVSVGKSGKYLNRWLKPLIWERFLSTYSKAEAEEIWEAVFAMCGLVDEAAAEIAEALGFTLDTEEACNSRAYLEHVWRLPKNAAEVY
ncbi:MAG: aminoglycoside 6-adenylyltransferase [Clostridiales bacterium]|nr:aminoglycoside 6-adenylyltransferase [Clostridiales bacterium]